MRAVLQMPVPIDIQGFRGMVHGRIEHPRGVVPVLAMRGVILVSVSVPVFAARVGPRLPELQQQQREIRVRGRDIQIGVRVRR